MSATFCEMIYLSYENRSQCVKSNNGMLISLKMNSAFPRQADALEIKDRGARISRIYLFISNESGNLGKVDWVLQNVQIFCGHWLREIRIRHLNESVSTIVPIVFIKAIVFCRLFGSFTVASKQEPLRSPLLSQESQELGMFGLFRWSTKIYLQNNTFLLKIAEKSAFHFLSRTVKP